MRVSEYFYSIQGEGRNMGLPSYFIRLSGCNLLCGGKGTIKDKKLHDGATWRCDSIESWIKGEKYSNDILIKKLEELESLKNRNIIFTGGEPLMQQMQIMAFIESVKDYKCTFEIESNGTIKPELFLIEKILQWNISPKLSNSGMPKNRRINTDSLDAFSSIGADFKFVVSKEEDIDEIYWDFLRPFNIKSDNVYLMPAASDIKDLQKMSILVADLCKKLNCKFSNRLHIQIWNQKTGV